MARRKDLTKEQILLAMSKTKSNRASCRYLNVSYIHYKKWAKFYHEFEGGRNLFDIHKNQSGKGIPKFLTGNNGNKSKWNVLDVIEGRISPTHFRPESLKQKMIDEGYLKEECAICGFHDRRINDYVMPLILDFADNNPQHYGLGNIRFLCYNCFFITRGNIFNKKDITQIETYTPKNGTSEAINFQLTPYQLEQMERLGVYQPPKPKPEDGSEFISRI